MTEPRDPQWSVEPGDEDHNPWVLRDGHRIAEVWGPDDVGSEADARQIVDALNAATRHLYAWRPDYGPDGLPESSLPARVVVGANGAYWRDYGTHYSMCPVSNDNDPVEVVASYSLATPRHGPHCDADLRRSGCVCTDASPEPAPRIISLDEAGPAFLRANPDYQGEPIIASAPAPAPPDAGLRALATGIAQSWTPDGDDVRRVHTPGGTVYVIGPVRAPEPGAAELKRLLAERERLIAAGADPGELLVPEPPVERPTS